MVDFEKFYNLALRFLSYRPRSEKEIRDKLLQKKASQEIIEKIVNKLKRYNFVNDSEFAKRWIEERIKLKPRSLRLIKIELKRKGITQEIIDKILGYKDKDMRILSDEDLAVKLVEKRIGRFKGLTKQEIYQKLGRFLASKGFDWDVIKKAIDPVKS